MSNNTLSIQAQITPNPNTLKFMVNKPIIAYGSVDFSDKNTAKKSPLPNALFEIDNVLGVFVGTSFVSVTKANDVDWSDLVEGIIETIKGVMQEDGPYVDENLIQEPTQSSGPDSETIEKIKAILDAEIRPAVAMDGGDIVFHKYEDGILFLHLQGACSSCPSSVMTLKMGVENRLKEDIPEIKEVVQI